MEWMLMPFQRYADFSGRSRRTEYWMFTLLNVLVTVVAVTIMLLGGGLDRTGSEPGVLFYFGLIILVIWVLAALIPSIAVAVRRFHDQDKSGWFYLLSFIPYVGGIILIVFMCIDGTNGPNQYGPDPKGGVGNADSVFD